MLIAQIILWVVFAYLAIGIIFALAFVTVGVSRVDPAARGAPFGFRLLILPGSVALWPWFWCKWKCGGKQGNA